MKGNMDYILKRIKKLIKFFVIILTIRNFALSLQSKFPFMGIL